MADISTTPTHSLARIALRILVELLKTIYSCRYIVRQVTIAADNSVLFYNNLKNEDFTIVVDGGASGCRLAAFDNHGVQYAVAQDGPASLSIGVDTAWQNISNGLSSLATQIGKSNNWLPKHLWMGLAGSLQSDRYNSFLSLIPREINPVVISDGHAQLLGASGGKPGICLAMGTGSVIHWLDTNSNFNHAGGWGYPIGDEASGAWLGAQLVNRYLWYRDRPLSDCSTSTMFAALERRTGKKVSDIQLWSTSNSSTDMASLAPIVVKAATDGDELAVSIVKSGTHYCQQLIDLAPDNLPVFIVGGLADLYTPHLERIYADRCQRAVGNALNGLYLYAKQQQEFRENRL